MEYYWRAFGKRRQCGNGMVCEHQNAEKNKWKYKCENDLMCATVSIVSDSFDSGGRYVGGCECLGGYNIDESLFEIDENQQH